MNLFRTITVPRKNAEKRTNIKVSFDMDDARKKVGEPRNSKKAKEKESAIAREMQKRGFSHSQIAKYLGYSVSTIKRRLGR
jgi:DNA invertase Pin-like site-specific DNA recombinase